MSDQDPTENHNSQGSSIRKLAVIMFTDIAGFTAVMGMDNEAGMKLIHANRELQRPLVHKYGGRMLKEIGDGTLLQFESAYQAVKCAIEIQQNAKGDLKEKIRIGIHLGDVTIEENDVFGDGVNIASRLENVADPGGIYVSESVRRAIRSHTDINLKFLGQITLKNVSDEIGVYAVMGDGIVQSSSDKIRKLRSGRTNPTRKILISILIISGIFVAGWFLINTIFLNRNITVDSIAVLPFDNLTGDENMDFLVAGLHDNLITTLAQISPLRVISRKSTMRYDSLDRSMPEIADELGVDALVETSISKSGEGILLNVQVIQAFPEERHLWAELYEGNEDGLRELLNTVAQSIVQNVDLSVTEEGQRRLEALENVHPEAYKAFIKGQFHANLLSPAGFDMAIEYFNKSIEIDPEYAPAYAGIAYTWIVKLQMKLVSVTEAIPRIYSNNRKALELDPEYPDSNYIKALQEGQAWNWEECEQAFKTAIRIDPNHALAHAHYSHILLMLKRMEEAIRECEIALKLDPYNDFIMALCAGVYYNTPDRIGEAMELSRKAYEINPNSVLNIGFFSRCYLVEGNYEKAVETFLDIFPGDSILSMEVKMNFERNGYRSAMGKIASMLEDSKENQIRAFMIATHYNIAEEYEKAIEWFEKAFENHHPDMPYAFIPAINTETLRTDPRYSKRFEAIAKKMDLPY